MPKAEFWDGIPALAFSNEGDVEVRLVVPLLRALGYDLDDIQSKAPVVFHEGSKGRKLEADFVVHASRPHGRSTSLIVVEAKAPGKPLDAAIMQAESYAEKLRAPLILVTNGEELKLLQLQRTGENEVVYESSVIDIVGRRGELELLASKPAVRELCKTLADKKLTVCVSEVTPYEESERRRLGWATGALERKLSRKEGISVSSTSLLKDFTQGAVIVGASGYGKTTLAANLAVQSIESRWAGDHTALTFEVFLPDLDAEDADVEKFLSTRLMRHLPQFTREALLDRSRAAGLVIVGDGYERVEITRRKKLIARLRTVRRDFPLSRVFLLARSLDGDLVTMRLPVLELQDYSASDVDARMRARGIARPEHLAAGDTMSDHLRLICREPLLADLVLDHLEAYRRYPTSIRPIYDRWLENLLSQFDPADRLMYRALLTSLAVGSTGSSLSIKSAFELAGKFGDARALIRDLTDVGALSVGSSTLEVVHEALADYLRAENFIEKHGSDLRGEAKDLSLEKTSHFPALLLAATDSLSDNRDVWRSMVENDVSVAMDTLRFTHGFTDSHDDSAIILDDILHATETVISTHFPKRSSDIIEHLTGTQTLRLGIRGEYDNGRVNYSFFDTASRQRRLPVSPSGRDPGRWLYYDLSAFGLGPDCGRALGVGAVFNAIKGIIEARELFGGRVWTEDLVAGRLQYLNEAVGIHFKDVFDLPGSHRTLAPQAEAFVSRTNSFGRGQSFSMSRLLADIEYLLDLGLSRIEPWWCSPDQPDLSTEADMETFARSLDAQSARTQKAYLEVVEANFPSLTPFLDGAQQFPARRELQVTASSERREIFLTYRDHPVSDIEDAGADVSFPSEVSEWSSSEALDEHHDATQTRVAELGPGRARYKTRSGWSMFHGFIVDPWHGDGLPYETVVVRDVTKTLIADMKTLFGRSPIVR
ncbi:type I restriction enzyme HsdR N-terminal domain-containing protein [Neorhizobium sp. BT27B]|uniref:type I restriction enzyme HsdR N-terminal domain-containing protein n=1 Tax=Neorhizobium sp. BT27B TaxID=3142625 RepID=UPI003D291EEE